MGYQFGTRTNVGRTNVGRDKRRTGQTSDGQTSDQDKRRTKTNVGPGQTSDGTNVGPGQTSDPDKRRTGTNVGLIKKNAKSLEAKYSFRTKIIPIKTTSYYAICM